MPTKVWIRHDREMNEQNNSDDNDDNRRLLWRSEKGVTHAGKPQLHSHFIPCDQGQTEQLDACEGHILQASFPPHLLALTQQQETHSPLFFLRSFLYSSPCPIHSVAGHTLPAESLWASDQWDQPLAGTQHVQSMSAAGIWLPCQRCDMLALAVREAATCRQGELLAILNSASGSVFEANW